MKTFWERFSKTIIDVLDFFTIDRTIIIGTIICIGTAFVFFVSLPFGGVFFRWEKPDYSLMSNLGDFMGGVFGPLLSFISVLLLVKSLREQTTQTRILKEELKRTSHFKVYDEYLSEIRNVYKSINIWNFIEKDKFLEIEMDRMFEEIFIDIKSVFETQRKYEHLQPNEDWVSEEIYNIIYKNSFLLSTTCNILKVQVNLITRTISRDLALNKSDESQILSKLLNEWPNGLKNFILIMDLILNDKHIVDYQYRMLLKGQIEKRVDVYFQGFNHLKDYATILDPQKLRHNIVSEK